MALGRYGALAVPFLLAACAGPGRGSVAAPAAGTVAVPETKPAARDDAAAEPLDPVELLSSGAEPRRLLRYAFATTGEVKLKSEVVLFRPLYSYETSYAAAETEGAGFAVPARITFTISNLPDFVTPSPDLPAQPECTTRIHVDARGLIGSGSRTELCDRVEASFHGLRATPLRPAVPLPASPVGVGARWRARLPGEAGGVYTLLDSASGALTVWGELEPVPAREISTPKPSSSTYPTTTPSQAWLLARVELGSPAGDSTLAWDPPSPGWTPRSKPLEGAAPLRIRVDSAAPGRAAALREQRRVLLERLLGSPDPNLRLSAVRASGIVNDWRLIAPLVELTAPDPPLRAAAAEALLALTGRSTRGPEDYVEAGAPYMCRGDPARAEALLARGIAAAAGHPTQQARLLARRADLRRELGQLAPANRDYLDALALAPADPDVARSVAWWFATAPDPKLRSGRRALELVRQLPPTRTVLRLEQQAEAAAHAELGNFDAALRIQRDQLAGGGQALNGGPGAEPRIAAATARLEAYSRRKPWREGLTIDEWPICYRYRGLSQTLL